jgi:hypothetical protein
MKEKPILFSTPMVEAILEHRKTMTRRTAGLEHVNKFPNTWRFDGFDEENIPAFEAITGDGIYTEFYKTVKPRYQVGDHLWVKETFSFAPLTPETKPFYPDLSDYVFKAGSDYASVKWKSSLFMPKVATRIWLECTAVRCEQLQSITEADAIAEGIEKVNVNQPFEGYKEYFIKGFTTGVKPVHSFFSLWMSINGIESLQLNPWVFVYEFKRIEKP